MDIYYHVSTYLQHREYVIFRASVRLGEYDILGQVIKDKKKRNRKNILSTWRDDILGQKYLSDRGILLPKEFTMWFTKSKLSMYNFYREGNTFRSYQGPVVGIVFCPNKPDIVHYNIGTNGAITSTLTIGHVIFRSKLVTDDTIIFEAPGYSLYCPPKAIVFSILPDGHIIFRL